LGRGDVALSLGTSDVVFAWIDNPKPILDGGVFCSAVDPEAFLAFVWYALVGFTSTVTTVQFTQKFLNPNFGSP
jgi:hypothetical protein